MEPTEVEARPQVPVRKGRRWPKVLLALLAAGVLIWLLRYPILRGVGAYLVDEDPLVHADLCFVLGGGAADRAEEATRLAKAGMADRFLFTGGNIHNDLSALGLRVTEAEVGRDIALSLGMPPDRAGVINIGTSTMEEAVATLERARLEGVDTVIVLSHRMHLRRVGRVFRDRFRKEGITVLLHGAPDHRFDERSWWSREEGLLMVNNEYVKLVYYALKY